MLAILNSREVNPFRGHPFRLESRFFTLPASCVLAGCAAIFFAGLNLLAGDYTQSRKLAGKGEFAGHAEKAYERAKAQFAAQPANPDAAWRLGQAAYDWADYATSSSQRAEIAGVGIAACRKLIEQDPKSAPGHYYLAMDLGQLARTKRLGALRIVGQMESEFKSALALDPKLDYAGPDRNLGLLYHEAPGWPASIGSKTKARLHLQNALKLAPEYPDNVLNLLEAELKWREKNNSLRELNALDEIWKPARDKFVGEDWAASWADWEARRELAKKALAQSSRAGGSPRKSSDD